MQGALVGLAIAVVMYLFELTALKKGANERAARLHRKPELDQTEKNRLSAVLRFAFFLPIGFALGFWLIF